MIFHVYKKKRTKNGKSVTDRLYRGRYRLGGDYAVMEVPLDTPDKQVAEQKLREIVKEREMERAGLIAPKLERDSASKSLLSHFEDFIADLKVKGRAEGYWKGVESNVKRLCRECRWKVPKDVQADDFLRWRSKQTVAPKTLNEYLNAMRAFMNWMAKHAGFLISLFSTLRRWTFAESSRRDVLLPMKSFIACSRCHKTTGCST